MEPPGAPYSTLDESSLRALLDETLDLDQRRLIRSALREVRRREIQDMEAALLSKRHRPSRRCTQEDKEDKENQHTPCSSDALHLLAQKVQEIRDLEELSTMLRSAPEYEERRIIRAAIRSIREHQEEQQEEKRSGIRSIREQQKEEQEEKGPGIREQQQEQQEEKGPGIRSIREEHSHVRRRRAEEEQRPEGGALEPQSTSTPHRPDSYKTGSCPGMMLVIGPQLKDEGPLPLLIQGSREALPSGASDLNQEALPSGASHLNQEALPSGASDLKQEALPSGASHLNQEALPSGASDLNQEALPSGASDLNQEALPSGALEPCASVCSDGKGPTDSEGESRAPALQDQTDGAMISTKDSVRGRLDQKITVNNSLSSRKHKDTELTLGLKASPFRISSTLTAPSVMMESESPSQLVLAPPSQLVLAPPSQLVLAPPSVGGATDLSNGGLPNAEECSSKVTPEFLAAIDDEETLDQMLDGSKDFEERRMIRAAMRDLRKRKRDQREKEREVRLQEQRQQRDQRDHRDHRTASRPGTEEVVIKKLESADGSTLSQVTKTNTFSQSDGSRSTLSTVTSYVHKTDRGTVQSKSFSFSSSTSSSTSSNTKVGSVFEREDSSVSRSSVVAAEKKKKEVQRSQTMTSSSLQARKALMERLDSSGGPAVVKINRVQRSTSFGVPNANTIKQMLLDWCRAKTRGYQHVEIQNFSSSWSSGMAFCALVHHFFPEAFDYSALQPSERRHNFELAFSTAERTVDCPQLLDVEDMVKLREPDWKCVYTYLQEFYRGLVTKGLVRTRANAS